MSLFLLNLTLLHDVSIFCLVLCLLRSSTADSTIRIGAVLSSEGNTELKSANNGYELAIHEINSHYGNEGFFLKGKAGSSGYRFKFDFLARDKDKNQHAKAVKNLITENRIHFLAGSHPSVAETEMKLSNEAGIPNYHCCVGPDHLYELDYPRVFGIPVSNTQYTNTLIRSLELSHVGKTAFVYEKDEAFTETTCQAAMEYHEEFRTARRSQTDAIVRNFTDSDLSPGFFKSIAAELKNEGVEAVIACVFKPEGKQLVDAFHEVEYSLKAFFLTVGPTDQSWIEGFDPPYRANDLLSAAQWHHSLNYTDRFFNWTDNYVNLYFNRYGDIPLYQSAGASAVILTLWYAIENAFEHCDISRTGGEVDALFKDSRALVCDDGRELTGYDRVVEALALTDEQTFFGRVRFNRFRRNVGLVPVTTQVFEKRALSGEIFQEVESVFPVAFATADFKYPAKNMYQEICRPGYYQSQDEFQPCVPCPRGEVSEVEKAHHCDSCPMESYMDEEGQTECKPCPYGTSTRTKGARSIQDCICKDGFFNRERKEGFACQECVEGADCAGHTSLPIPRKGFWADVASPYEVYSCDPAKNCPGGGKNGCADGYAGRLCSSCEDGYFSIIQECIRCWSKPAIVLACAALLLGWYVINAIVSKSVPSLEMILGWAQLANIIGDINLNWTPMVTKMFSVANILDFDVDILEPSCLFNWGFKHNFITQLCLPVVMTFMGCSGYFGSAAAFFLLDKGWIKFEGRGKWILSYLVDVPENKRQLKEKWDMTIATFLASVDITYVTIAKYCFDVFKCRDIAGVSVLGVDPDVTCYDSNHNILIGLASFGITVYVVGYLVYVSWKLYDLNERGCFSHPTDVRRYGFIYKKYEPDYNFTPAIVILRKLCFVLVLVYMNNPAFQIGAIAIIINASLMIHVYTAPYVDTYLDVLFSFLLLALMFEAFGGLMFYSENLPQANREILEWIIMVSLFMLIIVFLVIFVKEMTNKYKARFVMKMYRDYARLKNINHSEDKDRVSGSWGLSPVVRRLVSRNEEEDVNFELLETFDPGFVYQALRADSSFIEQWDKLTFLLKDFVSDQSDTSYLSMKRTAKYWRKLVDRLPELVDFLAVADEETRQKFTEVATNLYRNFYLTKKATRLPVIDIINWRDYAPMAQWLAIAPEEDRRFFLDFLSKMFAAVGQIDAAHTIAAKVEHKGKDPFIAKRRSIGTLSDKKREILNTLIRGDDPFHHPALERRLSDSTEAMRFRANGESSSPTPRASSAPIPTRGSSPYDVPLGNIAECREMESDGTSVSAHVQPMSPVTEVSQESTKFSPRKGVEIAIEMTEQVVK